MTDKTFSLYDSADREYAYRLPLKWCICEFCAGEGSLPIDIEAIDPEALACGYDPDSGAPIDPTCPDCRGSGKVRTVDESAIPDVILADMAERQRDAYLNALEAAAERRMGA